MLVGFLKTGFDGANEELGLSERANTQEELPRPPVPLVVVPIDSIAAR
jgi:hypothetical protein